MILIIYTVPYRRFYANYLFFKLTYILPQTLMYQHISASAVCIETLIKHKAKCDMEAKKRGQNVCEKGYTEKKAEEIP